MTTSPRSPAQDAAAGGWWAVGCLAAAIMLVALPLASVIVSGPSNPYAALMLVGLGLLSAAIACALIGFRLVTRVAPTWVATTAGLVAAIPPVLPMFGSTFIELWPVVAYGLALGAAHAIVRRWPLDALAFFGLWLLAAVGVAFVQVIGRAGTG